MIFYDIVLMLLCFLFCAFGFIVLRLCTSNRDRIDVLEEQISFLLKSLSPDSVPDDLTSCPACDDFSDDKE